MNNKYTILTHRQNSLVCEFILKKRFFDGMVEKNNYHFHSLFEVHICVKGSMHILVEDKNYFYRRFSAMFGTTPGKYRNEEKGM